MSALDAIVVGGGPAGLSAAIGLARAGLSVKLFEQKKEWGARVCGSFLSPEASLHLKWLGLLESVKENSAITNCVTLSYEGQKCEPLQINLGPEDGLAIPRKKLEELLLRQAIESGVEVKHGFSVTQTFRVNHKIWKVHVLDLELNREETLFTQILVSSNGRFSRFRNSKPSPTRQPWLGWNAEFKGVQQNTGTFQLCFFRQGYVGTLTFKDGTTNISGLVHANIIKQYGKNLDQFLQDLTQSNSAIKKLLQNAVQVSPFQMVAALPFGKYINKNSTLFLTGDTAAVCDPYMGEGIARALSAGPMLFEAFKSKTPHATYLTLWNKHYSIRMRIGYCLRTMLLYPTIVSKSIKLISKYRCLQKWLLGYLHK